MTKEEILQVNQEFFNNKENYIGKLFQSKEYGFLIFLSIDKLEIDDKFSITFSFLCKKEIVTLYCLSIATWKDWLRIMDDKWITQ
jgi:hypothetical protein